MEIRYDGLPLGSPSALGGVANKDEVVVRAPGIRVVVSYPFTQAREYTLPAPPGLGCFTRAGLAGAICDLFRRIYETTGTSDVPLGSLRLDAVCYHRAEDKYYLEITAVMAG